MFEKQKIVTFFKRKPVQSKHTCYEATCFLFDCADYKRLTVKNKITKAHHTNHP